VADASRHGADPGIGYGSAAEPRTLTRLEGDSMAFAEAVVAEEVPVAFVYGARTHVVMMASPIDLEDLAVGFTLTEGIVSSADAIGAIEVVRHSRGIELHIAIPHLDEARLQDRARTLAGRTGCGLCGVEAIDDAVRPAMTVASTLRITRSALYAAGAALDARQPLNADTRAAHAAAWATPDGSLVVVREDVGRHNALDKVIGALARSKVDPRIGFAVVTSRASFELVQKVATLGIPLLAAVSRPTGLAVRLAEGAGIGLVGLLRGTSANVYAHPERILAG
jgi:FdhD protein